MTEGARRGPAWLETLTRYALSHQSKGWRLDPFTGRWEQEWRTDTFVKLADVLAACPPQLLKETASDFNGPDSIKKIHEEDRPRMAKPGNPETPLTATALSDPPRWEGTWPWNDLRRAFVEGAKWWEWNRAKATMWASDRDLAEAEADKRYAAASPPPAAEKAAMNEHDDHDCTDWNSGGACAICRRPLSVEEQTLSIPVASPPPAAEEPTSVTVLPSAQAGLIDALGGASGAIRIELGHHELEDMAASGQAYSLDGKYNFHDTHGLLNQWQSASPPPSEAPSYTIYAKQDGTWLAIMGKQSSALIRLEAVVPEVGIVGKAVAELRAQLLAGRPQEATSE